MKTVVWGLVLLLVILHHDVWLWDNKTLVAGFMKGELVPHLESGSDRVERLQNMVDGEDSGDVEFYRRRVSKLNIWRARGSEMMELVQQLLD